MGNLPTDKVNNDICVASLLVKEVNRNTLITINVLYIQFPVGSLLPNNNSNL